MPRQTASPQSPLRTFFDTLEKKYPQYDHYLKLTHTAADYATATLDAASPYIAQATNYAVHLQAKASDFHVEEYGPMLLGLALCFFGGSYTMLVAVAETVRLLCWEDLKRAMQVLYENYQVAAEQNRKDNLVDEDGNGVADVQEISSSELLSRKTALFFKSIDVEVVRSACHTLSAAFLSVIAALRVRFARNLALGGALAEMASQYVPLEAILREALPPEQKKWAGLAANGIFHMMTLTLATMLSAVLGTVHCCIRGSHMFVQGAVHIAQKRGFLEEAATVDNAKAKALATVVASMGLLWQLTYANAHPFPLNLILLPFTAVECILSLMVNGSLFVTF